MTRIALVAVILLASLMIGTAADVTISCPWTKVSPTGEVHYAFLLSNPKLAPLSLRLYQSSWSAKRTLLSCAWINDAAVIENYLALCQKRTREFSDNPPDNLDVHSLYAGDELCVSVASPGFEGPTGMWRANGHNASETYQGQGEKTEGKAPRRMKRSNFIFPGTLWCGAGNQASSYEELGRLVLYSRLKNLNRPHVINGKKQQQHCLVILKCIIIFIYLYWYFIIGIGHSLITLSIPSQELLQEQTAVVGTMTTANTQLSPLKQHMVS